MRYAICIICTILQNYYKNTHGGVLLSVKLQAKSPWVFFKFFKLYKWYQIAQSITIKKQLL